MSKGQTFPDAIVFSDGTISTVPDYDAFEDSASYENSSDRKASLFRIGSAILIRLALCLK
jgi:hypothetical protein